MTLPDKIDVCPIIDSVVEVRFKSNTHPNAVFGLIFNALKEKYPKVEKLPILQLPEQLRDADPNFKGKAHYKIISTDNYSVQIGPDVIVIGSPNPYPGWNEFSKRVYYVIDKVLNIGVIDSIGRLGIRFVNFFSEDIFGKIDLEITVKFEKLIPKNTVLRTEIQKGDFTNTLQIANNVTQKLNNYPKIGSIIDIDTFKLYHNNDFTLAYKKEIEKGHIVEKEIFFNLMKEDFLLSLKPTYNERN